MKRRIINIEDEKCNGCGLCVSACHEGAIELIDGKAVLTRDDYCDGLGDCLPTCPTGAITFVEREAAAYDEKAVLENQRKKMQEKQGNIPCGCPGSQVRILNNDSPDSTINEVEIPALKSHLAQWPVQIKLVPVKAPYFDGCKLLIAADCTAFAYANFHEDFIKDHITLIGCPKLDDTDYSEKLTEIIKYNNIKSVKILRMEVPCCSGIEIATKKALQDSGKFIPWQVVIISTDGKIL